MHQSIGVGKCMRIFENDFGQTRTVQLILAVVVDVFTKTHLHLSGQLCIRFIQSFGFKIAVVDRRIHQSEQMGNHGFSTSDSAGYTNSLHKQYLCANIIKQENYRLSITYCIRSGLMV